MSRRSGLVVALLAAAGLVIAAPGVAAAAPGSQPSAPTHSTASPASAANAEASAAAVSADVSAARAGLTGGATTAGRQPGTVWPTPQQLTRRPGSITLPGSVVEVVGAATDPAALTALAATLHAAGVRTITTVSPGRRVPRAALTIYVGTPDDNAALAPELAALQAQGPAGLAAGGYVLASGRVRSGSAVVLAGVDATGTFYAVQTLRQLIVGRTVRNVVVRDWPTIAVRGVIEGFYGPSWSDSDIASQLQFYGANKLNTFVYSAKNDPYLRDQWQTLYPADQLASLTTLVDDAAAQHVNFVYALSPGLSVCYSDPTDLAQLEAKDQQLWDAGVRQFAIFFDDIGTGFNCTADQTTFGTPSSSGASPQLAAAQAYLLNAFVSGFIDTHPGAQELITVPTDYAGVTDSAYRDTWKAQLDPDVLVYWTGVGVIPQTITADQAAAVASQFGHQIVVWDNYPVNDYDPTRLFQGPLVGRAADLGTAVAGFTSNPMQEAAPSMIPEFTTADYTWNPTAYTAAPDTAWQAGIAAYGGAAGPALQVFADNNQSTPRIGTLPESPQLAADIAAFWTADNADAGPAISSAVRQAADRLTRDWAQIAAAPALIKLLLPHQDFVSQAGPWLDKTGYYGLAGVAAVRYLLDTKAGRSTSADQAVMDRYYAKAAAIPQVTGQGVFQNFMFTADPSLFRYSVLLYAADATDYQAALAAAAGAGLSASQVTQNYEQAWNATSSGEFLVIAVGGPADNALYYNQCGWTAPNGLGGGSTPFDYTSRYLQVVLTNIYANGAGQTAADTAARSAALAYYAVYGTYPPDDPTPPALALPAHSCAGSPTG